MYMTASNNYRWETGNGLQQAVFFFLKELQHRTCLDTSTNQKYTKKHEKNWGTQPHIENKV